MADMKTSAEVGYRHGVAGKQLVLETDDSPSLVPEKGTSYVRVFPTVAAATVTAVMGTARKIGTNIPKKVNEYVSFNGTASSPLRYYPTGSVAVSDAKFFNAKPSVVFEAKSNSLVLDQEAFGIVKVTYTSYYDRYVVGHGDSPCKAAQTIVVGGGEPDTSQPTYDPAYLVATADEWETAALEVSGPPCSQDNEGFSQTAQFNNYEPTGLKIEVDSAIPQGIYPFYFNANNTPLGFTLMPQTVVIGGQSITLYCGCRVRVYPRVPVTLMGVNCAVSTSVVGQGERSCSEAKTFSGSQSESLDYPPAGAVSIYNTSANALSLFSEDISVMFRGPGEWVNEVVWTSRNTYRLAQGSRMVRPDEIVATTTLGNNTVPCYTFAHVGYTSEYYLFDVLFNFDPKTQWYMDAMVVATDTLGRVTSHAISPPGKGGVL
jgi:hypothetical protein